MGELKIRLTELSDELFLKKWLMDPAILCWFPMINEKEVDDSIKFWMSYVKISASVTATFDNIPCAMAVLYIQGYKKLAHQCLFSVIVDEEHRGKGVGAKLLTQLQRHAKKQFGIELLHLEVYEGNPAQHLYKKLGFVEYGKHPYFTKENGNYLSKVLMQKSLCEELEKTHD